MAFELKKWKNRKVEYPGRRTLTNISTGGQTVVDIARNEGLVSEEGDMFSEANMNGLEERIKAALDGLETSFQAGCSTIAKKITACGVSTADNASPATMAANIQTIYNNRYNQGKDDVALLFFDMSCGIAKAGELAVGQVSYTFAKTGSAKIYLKETHTKSASLIYNGSYLSVSNQTLNVSAGRTITLRAESTYGAGYSQAVAAMAITSA